jgi:hypothetical protein
VLPPTARSRLLSTTRSPTDDRIEHGLPRGFGGSPRYHFHMRITINFDISCNPNCLNLT